MKKKPIQLFIKPGLVSASRQNVTFTAIVGFGIAVVLVDRKTRRFGLGHYLFPASCGSSSARPFCADQVIRRLLELFETRGSRAENLNAWLIGGACRPGRFDIIELSDKNSCEGYELLENKRILIKGIQIGGYRGRRVFVHYPGTKIDIQTLGNQHSAEWLILNTPMEQVA